MGSTATGAPNTSRVGKIAFFDRSRSLQLSLLTTDNLCSSPLWSAFTTVRCVTNIVGGSRSLLVTRPIWHQQRWLSQKFVYHTLGSLQRYVHVTWSIAGWLCDSWAYCYDAHKYFSVIEFVTFGMLYLILCLMCRLSLQNILKDCLIKLIYLSLQCCCDCLLLLFCWAYVSGYMLFYVQWLSSCSVFMLIKRCLLACVYKL